MNTRKIFGIGVLLVVIAGMGAGALYYFRKGQAVAPVAVATKGPKDDTSLEDMIHPKPDCGLDEVKRTISSKLRLNLPMSFYNRITADDISAKRKVAEDKCQQDNPGPVSNGNCFSPEARGPDSDCSDPVTHYTTRTCIDRQNACLKSQQEASDAKDHCISDAYKTISDETDTAFTFAMFDFNNIRMESKNPTTGAVSCAATIHAHLPNGMGDADADITYLVEQTTEKHLYVTVNPFE